MTMQVTQTYGTPPEYPSDQMVPREYWRKSAPGIASNPQTITIETPTGPQKRTIDRGWEHPVDLSSD